MSESDKYEVLEKIGKSFLQYLVFLSFLPPLVLFRANTVPPSQAMAPSA
jgi:hypothetical protein